ncbi:MAG: pre-peptidase C-terminal domain-containing protein [Magnetococcales bacterium]|nr:pre-peptidase C-terminal domain-containing protein [Magnetococcales bacterium]
MATYANGSDRIGNTRASASNGVVVPGLGNQSLASQMALNPATAAPTENVDTNTDHDWYGVVLQPNTLYTFTMVRNVSAVGANNTLIPSLGLKNASGADVAVDRYTTNTPTMATFQFTTGTGAAANYYLDASSNGRSRGAYTIGVAADLANTVQVARTTVDPNFNANEGATWWNTANRVGNSTLALDGSGTITDFSFNQTRIRGFIDKRGDVDIIPVTLEAGKSYRFDMVRTGGTADKLNPHMRLLAVDGTTVLYKNDNVSANTTNSRISTVPTDSKVTADGLYYLEVSGAANTFGAYDVSVQMTDAGVSVDVDGTTGTAASVVPGVMKVGSLVVNDALFAAAPADAAVPLDVAAPALAAGTAVTNYGDWYQMSNLSADSVYAFGVMGLADANADPEARNIGKPDVMAVVKHATSGVDVTNSVLSQDGNAGFGFFSPAGNQKYLLAVGAQPNQDQDADGAIDSGVLQGGNDLITNKVGLYQTAVVEIAKVQESLSFNADVDNDGNDDVALTRTLNKTDVKKDMFDMSGDWYKVNLAADTDYTFSVGVDADAKTQDATGLMVRVMQAGGDWMGPAGAASRIGQGAGLAAGSYLVNVTGNLRNANSTSSTYVLTVTNNS